MTQSAYAELSLMIAIFPHISGKQMKLLMKENGSLQRVTELLLKVGSIECDADDFAKKLWLDRYNADEVIGPRDCQAFLHLSGLQVTQQSLVAKIATVLNVRPSKIDFRSNDTKTKLTIDHWKEIYGNPTAQVAYNLQIILID
jgi:hypothetical protein